MATQDADDNADPVPAPAGGSGPRGDLDPRDPRAGDPAAVDTATVDTPTGDPDEGTTLRAGWRAWFTAGDALDRTFALSILAKGLLGLSEVIGGLLLLVVTPAQLDAMSKAVIDALTRRELGQDPHDWLANVLLHRAHPHTFSDAGLRFAAAYLLVHGVVKLVLVVALVRHKPWAYPWMIGVLLAFIAYQLVLIAQHPTASLILLTAFDAFMAWLTWQEWRRHRSRLEARAAAKAAAP